MGERGAGKRIGLRAQAPSDEIRREPMNPILRASLCRNSLTTGKPLSVESSVFLGVIEVRKHKKNTKNKKNEKMMSCNL